MGRVVALVGLVALLIGGAAGYAAGGRGLLTPAAVAAADECRTFPETGKRVCGRFLAYWQGNGGLAQQGLPLSDAFDERSSADGRTRRVQYFERAVFELHPENAPPYDVLLSQLGREKYAAKYPSSAPVPPAAGAPGIGGTATATGYTLTLHAVADPSVTNLIFKPQNGFRFVAFDLTLVNIGLEPADYTFIFAKLKTADNREYTPTLGAAEPRLGGGTQRPGEATRGWLTFEIPADLGYTTLYFTPAYGRPTVAFDLR